jgi:hypothetical protein
MRRSARQSLKEVTKVIVGPKWGKAVAAAGNARRVQIAKIVDALEKAGITFLPANAQGVGLRGRIES